MPNHGIDQSLKMHFGSDGRPFLTRKRTVPDYKKDYPFYMQPQAVRHVSVDVLDLSKTEDHEYYLKIWKAVGLGSVQVVEEAKQWVDETKNWKVFIRWFIKGKMDPAELRSEIAKVTRSLRSGPEMLVEEEGDTNGPGR
jgi:hypothetical protein